MDFSTKIKRFSWEPNATKGGLVAVLETTDGFSQQIMLPPPGSDDEELPIVDGLKATLSWSMTDEDAPRQVLTVRFGNHVFVVVESKEKPGTWQTSPMISAEG